MYTERDLQDAFARIGIDPHGTLLVHSSMKALGPVDGGADTVLNAFSAYMRDGLLVFPGHTYEPYAAPDGVFDPLTEPPCVGLLPRLFHKRPGVVRSIHPTHSLCALGADASAFVSGEEESLTPCPRTGCWGKLYDRGAQVLFMGAPLYTNTLIHGAEEWAGVPDRLSRRPRRIVIRHPQRGEYAVMQYTHWNPGGTGISMRYGKLREPLLAAGAAVAGNIGDAECLLCDVRHMVDVTMEFLEKKPDLFMDDAAVPTAYYNCWTAD